MPTIINLTPHPINLHRKDGTVLTFPPSGAIARVSETRYRVGRILDADVEIVEYDKPQNLPDELPDVWYIVSGIVLAAAPKRPDLLAPGQPVRDDNGMIVGCKGWTTTRAFEDRL
ncbi:MAG: hypothetical protein EBR82_30645 [Caulobacteraceae bacterium]|nr:hypothetical protein [Caulobacteraceae bacterium]